MAKPMLLKLRIRMVNDICLLFPGSDAAHPFCRRTRRQNWLTKPRPLSASIAHVVGRWPDFSMAG